MKGIAADLSSLSADDVRCALKEFCTRRRDDFMRHYGIRNRAQTHFIRYRGQGGFDMKPIARVALGQTSGPFANTAIVRRRLQGLGFEVYKEPRTRPDGATLDENTRARLRGVFTGDPR